MSQRGLRRSLARRPAGRRLARPYVFTAAIFGEARVAFFCRPINQFACSRTCGLGTHQISLAQSAQRLSIPTTHSRSNSCPRLGATPAAGVYRRQMLRRRVVCAR